MLCDDVRRTVYLFLEGVLAEPTQHDFAEHLQLCAKCETRTRVHRRLRVFILKRLHPDTAPERLKQRLLRTFRAIKAEWA